MNVKMNSPTSPVKCGRHCLRRRDGSGPFPPFWGMASIQAIELEPDESVPVDRGCVVVTPEGAICGLGLVGILGAEGAFGEDFVEELTELQLPAEEYVIYARTAIKLLDDALRTAGG